MAIRVKRTFYFAKTSELNSIPLEEGNYIALSDADGMFYDVGNPAGSGQNITRREVSGRIIFVQALPEIGDENNTYVLDTGTKLIGTDQPYYEVYCWENNAWQKIATNTNDVNVTAAVSNNTRYYLTGSASSTSNTGTLIKRDDVFVDTTGKLNVTGGYGGGPVDNAINATNATNAVNATNATNDNLGNVISAYFKGVSVSGTSVVFTKGDNTTVSIDTFAPEVVSTDGPGLAPQIPVNVADNILSRDPNDSSKPMWVPLDVSDLPALSATDDSAGQEIIDTYIKDISFDNSTRTLTAIKGNDSTLAGVVIPDTTYQPYAGSSAGLVPSSTSGSATRFLRVDGTWQEVPNPVFGGATSSSDGSSGIVPAPTSSDINSYLKGDGTWNTLPVFQGADEGLVPSAVSADKYLQSDGTWVDLPEFVGTDGLENGTSGLVPASTTLDIGKYLDAEGNWSNVPDMTGASASTNGTNGLVPAPTSSDIDKYLKGDGTWSNISVPIFTYNTNGSVPAPGSINASNYLSASGIWRPVTLNTAGTSESNGQTSSFTDRYLGDGSTVSFTLSETPINGTLSVLLDSQQLILDTDYTLSGDVITLNNAPTTVSITDNFTITPVNLYTLSAAPQSITSVTVSGNTVSSSNYTVTGNVLSFNDPSGYTENDPVVITYAHIQVVNATYNASLDNAKLYIVSAPNQSEYSQTYSNSSAYVKAGKLYSNNEEVVTEGSTVDTSFTANANLSIAVNKVGSAYYITLDGTANGIISAGSAIATTTKTFIKSYSVGMVGTTPALFKIEGSSITCDTAISANTSVAVSLNALE